MDSLNTKNDPLLAFVDRVPSWRKVFVEPIPQLYEKLKESVKRWPNASAHQLAISPNTSVAETTAEMFCLEEGFDEQKLGTDLPYWANQVCCGHAASFLRCLAGASRMSGNAEAEGAVCGGCLAAGHPQFWFCGQAAAVQSSVALAGHNMHATLLPQHVHRLLRPAACRSAPLTPRTYSGTFLASPCVRSMSMPSACLKC